MSPTGLMVMLVEICRFDFMALIERGIVLSYLNVVGRASRSTLFELVLPDYNNPVKQFMILHQPVPP